MKSTFIFLFLISLLSACLPGKGGLATEIKTSTFTPTEEPGIRVETSQIELSSVLEFNDRFAPLQTGTYFIYYDWPYDVAYMRLDGARHGNILEFLEEADLVELSNDSENPQLFIAQFGQEQVVLHRINLSERTTKSVSVSIKDDTLCYDDYYCFINPIGSFSPDGNWFLGTYIFNNRSLPYLIDLVNLQGVYLDSGSYYCKSPKEGYGWGVDWSPNSSWFYLNCSDKYSSSGEYMDCFGSAGKSDVVCHSAPSYFIYSISPDGKKVAVVQINSEDQYQWNEGILYIINYDCLVTGEICEDYLKIPYRSSISTAWSRSGQYLVWFDYPLIVSRSVIDSGYTTIWKIDNWKKETSIITEWAPKGSHIISLSPDDEWVLFERPNQIFSSFSLVNQITLTLPFEEFHPPHVLGWWVIP